MEIFREKSVDTRIVFPILDADGDFVTGAADLDSEYASWDTTDHAGTAPSFADCTHEATEIGSTGVYYLDVQSTEIAKDYTIIQVKTSTSGAKTQYIVISTVSVDSSNIDTIVSSTSGLTYTVSGKVDANVYTWRGTSVPTEATAGYPIVTIKTGSNSGEVGGIIDGVWDELQTDHTTDGTFGDYLNYPITGVITPAGTGTLAITYSLTLSDNGLPIANARVWVSTDSGHSDIVASDTTDAFGVVHFNLDPGTYYFWRYKSGVNFTNPLTGTFSTGVQSASGTGTLVDTIATARIKNVTYAGSI